VPGASEKLKTYKAKRDFDATPEPTGAKKRRPRSKQPRFVIQEHHASALHWDFRLERDGVLVSWAVPKGLPMDTKTNHLAVHVEDHPLDYFDFEGTIADGNYGAGQVYQWDKGTYDEEKWTDREVKVVLHGTRVDGRYVLFSTGKRGGRDWMVHRMDPPTDPGWEPLPTSVKPMLATSRPTFDLHDGEGAARASEYAYEMKWDGVRALVYVDGGRIRIESRNLRDVTVSYPELRGLGESLGSRQVLLDGEIVAFDASGRPSFSRLQERMHVGDASKARRLASSVPAVYLAFDVLHLDGRDVTKLPYVERRSLLEGLGIAGPSWQVPPAFEGNGAAALKASQDAGLEGIVAKKSDSAYHPGRRSDCWVKVKNIRGQEVVVAGWKPGQGGRTGQIGSLLLGVYDEDGRLNYAGHVGTGFGATELRRLEALLKPLRIDKSPFSAPNAGGKDAIYTRPEVVAQVEFTEWTPDGKLRHPSYKGTRDDKDPREVIREP
jgi:bifunctional non-homologous end joining protein LigD